MKTWPLKCPLCGHEWKDAEEFLTAGAVRFKGYQADLNNVESGFFFFNHSCRTSILLPVTMFVEFFKVKINRNAKYDPTTAPDCPGYCVAETDMNDCRVMDCKGYWVREIIVFLRK